MSDARPIEPDNPTTGLWWALAVGVGLSVVGGFFVTRDGAELVASILLAAGGLATFIAGTGLGVYYGMTAARTD